MSEMNTQVLLAARPIGLPKESDFEIVEREAGSPGEGQVLIRQRLLSLDPAMRGWMNDRRSYVPPVGLGEVMRGYGVGEVVESRTEALEPGDLVAGLFGWQRFATGRDLPRWIRLIWRRSLPESMPRSRWDPWG
jgi:NADPH-dependent curcumin reductase CurA